MVLFGLSFFLSPEIRIIILYYLHVLLLILHISYKLFTDNKKHIQIIMGTKAVT